MVSFPVVVIIWSPVFPLVNKITNQDNNDNDKIDFIHFNEKWFFILYDEKVLYHMSTEDAPEVIPIEHKSQIYNLVFRWPFPVPVWCVNPAWKEAYKKEVGIQGRMKPSSITVPDGSWSWDA